MIDDTIKSYRESHETNLTPPWEIGIDLHQGWTAL